MKISQTIAAGVLALGMGSAFAAEPVALNDTQMDNVTAGFAWAGSNASGSALWGSVQTGTGATATHTTCNCHPGYTDTASTYGYANASGFLVSAHSSSAAVAF